MTTLGKILVIVNFVFSLVTGILILMVFVARTNWKAGYEQLEKNYNVSRTNVDTYAQEVAETRRKMDQEVEKITTLKNTAETERDKVKAELTAKMEQIALEEAKAKTSTNNATSSQAELERRRGETAALQKNLDGANDKVLALQTQAKKLQDEAMGAKIAFNSEHDHNLRLLESQQMLAQKLELMEKKLATGSAGSATTVAPRNPPPEDIEGIVLVSDPKSGLVTISLGTDAGINPGNTLEVYRLKPEPRYLGTLRILDAHHHEAVARLTAPPRYGPIEKGDLVASKIMTTRR